MLRRLDTVLYNNLRLLIVHIVVALSGPAGLPRHDAAPLRRRHWRRRCLLRAAGAVPVDSAPRSRQPGQDGLAPRSVPDPRARNSAAPAARGEGGRRRRHVREHTADSDPAPQRQNDDTTNAGTAPKRLFS